jgi:pimeloyl-ACP methyl ester carboxylesterase
MSSDRVQVRVHGDPSLPTLVYLPGLHGDWTLVGSFRKQVEGRLRFVELTYPRTLDWSLQDYAAGVEAALAAVEIGKGWILGESFGSQIAWPLATRKRFGVEGMVLAGGFGKHPMHWGVVFSQKTASAIPLGIITRALIGYARISKWRFRNQPEALAGVKEFIERRTELDRQAAVHRLRLIAENDPSALARELDVPLYAVSGVLDPIVPWHPARKWLQQNCPRLKEFKIIRSADHTVLSTGSKQAAEHIVGWITAEQKPDGELGS